MVWKLYLSCYKKIDIKLHLVSSNLYYPNNF